MYKKIHSITINGRFLTQSTTGVQRYAREIISALDEILDKEPNIKITVLAPKSELVIPVYKNIIVKQIGSFKGHLWEQLILPFYVNRDSILFCPCNTAPLISLLTRKVVVTVHDLSYRYFPHAYNILFKFFYSLLTPLIFRFASKIITVSNSELRSIISLYPFVANRISAIQNGGQPIATTKNTFDSNNSRKKKSVLYVGSLSKRKNFHGMLKVAEILTNCGVEFIFVGGVSSTLQASIFNDSHINDNFIKFTGQIEDWETLSKYYLSATCFLFPSFYEASPLPPIEAMACGCPVIASSISSLIERCEDSALYCDPYDINQIANTIQRFINDPNLQNEMRSKGFEQANKFTWLNCASNSLKVLLS